MKIPKSFKIFAHDYIVEYKKDLSHEEDKWGTSSRRTHKITLQPNTEGIPMHKDEIEHTFLHELTHIILGSLGYTELSSDEQFVDSFSNLLHQALTTME